MENLNLNDIEQIMTFYLIFNFVIFACIIYIIISLIFRILSKKKKIDETNKNKKNKSKNKRKKKDIIDLFWTEDKDSKGRTIFKRGFLIILIVFTLYYIFNSINFIIANIDVVKKVLKIE
ncbi:hypothetical protein [Brachyspira murdochii]|uniref:Uncharacterized protein n=1 Tax=Brachyspira murdochii TaxID=84378 RepID=A0ABX5B234_9SPIR|nr:hypothetical protein [Brachyspira murdochii]PPS20712.1 hypothetical protein DJ52_15260 [Brachyspira murdochii]